MKACGLGPPAQPAALHDPMKIFSQCFKNGLRFLKLNKHMSLSIMTPVFCCSPPALLHGKVIGRLRESVLQSQNLCDFVFRGKGGAY